VANDIGKRYVCAQCPAQLLVSKSGDGELACLRERGNTDPFAWGPDILSVAELQGGVRLASGPLD
jgi:hypothetical protein